MKHHSRTLIIVAYLLLAGCSFLTTSLPKAIPPQTQYDSIIVDDRGRLLSVTQLAEKVAKADVVVVGEYHGHHGAHLLQMRVQSALYQQHPRQVLSMEQFTLNDQPELDRYLAGQTGEEELIADTSAWPNYKASYRPLIEFSRNRSIPVIATNAPEGIVRCVGRNGESYLDKLSAEERQRLPEEPFVGTENYREKFFNTLGTGHGKALDNQRLENSYKAQLLRDNTMADQVIKALMVNPDHQLIHLTGTFHSEERLGMVAVLEKKRPDLEVAVLSPVFWHPTDEFGGLIEKNRESGDFLYFLQPLPAEYKNHERHQNAILKQFSKSDRSSCD